MAKRKIRQNSLKNWLYDLAQLTADEINANGGIKSNFGDGMEVCYWDDTAYGKAYIRIEQHKNKIAKLEAKIAKLESKGGA